MPEVYVLPKTKKLPLRQAGSWCVLEIRGARDIPGYNVDEVGRGMSPNNKRREVGGDWSASSGKVVFEEYGDIHEPHEPLPFDPQRDLVCGWDLPAATGGTPAFVASQISGTGQWCIYGSLLPGADETVGVWEFAERVAKYLTETFAEPCGLRLQDLKLVHYGDPAGAQRPLSGGPKAEVFSAYEIIRNGDRIETGLDPYTREPVYQERKGWGWSIQPGEVSSIKRIECVRARLCANVRGAPAVVLSPKATFLREAFRGGYHFKQRSDGQYELDPNKNRHSHPMEAAQYCASRLFLQHPEEDPRAKAAASRRRNEPAGRTAGGRGRR